MGITVGNSAIGEVYYGNSAIGEIYYGSTLVYSSGVKLTVNTFPANAAVNFSTGKVNGKTVKVKKGTAVTYTVYLSGYYTQSGTISVTANQEINIVLEQQFYSDNQLLYECGTGGYSATLYLMTTGRYHIIAVGGGGGGAAFYKYTMSRDECAAGGGSGSYFSGIFYLPTGAYESYVGGGGYAVTTDTTSGANTAGAGNSTYINNVVAAHGGQGGYIYASTHEQAVGGAGGALPDVSSAAISIEARQVGYTGGAVADVGTVNGGAGLYGSWGAGGGASTSGPTAYAGNPGYLRVIFLGK